MPEWTKRSPRRSTGATSSGISLIWIAKGWAIAAVATLVVLCLIGRFTTWGRQFWRVTGAYFIGRDSVRVWVWLAAILLLSVITGCGWRAVQLPGQRHVDQLPGRWQAAWPRGDDAVKQSGKDGFWMSMLVFCVLATLNIVRLMLDLYLAQRFMPRVARLADRSAHRATGSTERPIYRARFIDDTIDNPDQRIQSDIDIFTAGVKRRCPICRTTARIARCCSARSRRSRR